MRGEFHHGEICGIRLCAACASNAHNENRGHNTGEAGFARHFRFSSMAKYSFRKRCWPRVLRGTAITPAQWNAEVAPVGFICAAPKVSCGAGCGISGLGNALQISPPPLQRSFRSYNTLAKPEICSGKTLFLPNGRVGRPYRTLGAMRSVAGKTARSEKSDFPPKTKCGLPPPESALFGLSPRGGRAGFRGARTGAGAG